MAKHKIHDNALEALLESAVDGIITIDQDAIIQSMNPAALLLFGYSTEKCLGQNVNCLMPEPWASAHDGNLWNYQNTGHKKVIGIGREVQGLKSDGSTFPVHLAVSEYEVEGSTYYTGIFHDLTSRKHAEKMLQRSQKMEAIGQLTGGIAHDFNNLLTVIIGNLELLEMRLTDEQQQNLLKEAQEAAELGAELTDRLLAFARRSNLAPKVINLSQILDTMIGLLHRTLGENIDLQTSQQENLWPVKIDPGQIESAILNLAVNARDAMPNGGKLIVETKNVVVDNDFAASEDDLEAGEFVCISVTDTGQGMSVEVLASCFEPFFSTKGIGKGTGLGLSMVYGFTKQSDGHITIYSEVGLGTTINLYLPKFDKFGKPVETSSNRADDKLLMGNQEVVLVVEDNERVKNLSAQRLKYLNYKVITANNGDEALEILKLKSDISLVFTDFVMPGKISGYDLIGRLQRDHEGVKILLTSGYAEDLVHNEKLSRTKVKLLRKPYKQADLARMISEVLKI